MRTQIEMQRMLLNRTQYDRKCDDPHAISRCMDVWIKGYQLVRETDREAFKFKVLN